MLIRKLCLQILRIKLIRKIFWSCWSRKAYESSWSVSFPVNTHGGDKDEEELTSTMPTRGRNNTTVNTHRRRTNHAIGRSRRRRTRRRSQAFSRGRRRMQRSPMKVTKKQQWRGRRGMARKRNKQQKWQRRRNGGNELFFFKLISPGVHLSFPLNCWVHQQ